MSLRIGIAAAPLFHSVLQDLAVIGGISTFAFVFALFRFKQAEVVPPWWWLASAAFLAIVGFVGEGISAGRGLAIILSGVALGIGVQRFFELWRSGRLHLRRRRPPTTGELVEQMDWTLPTFHVIDLTAINFAGLAEDNPYFDFSIRVLNGSVFAAELQPDIRGRISVDGAELNQQPDFLQIEANNTIRPLAQGSDWTIERNVPVRITLRQHVLPKVAEKLRGHDVSLSFANLDIGLRLVRGPWPEREQGERQRLPILGAHQFSMPSG